jgi:hypothetical protein
MELAIEKTRREDIAAELAQARAVNLLHQHALHPEQTDGDKGLAGMRTLFCRSKLPCS